MLKKGERVDYKLHLTFKIASKNDMIKDSEVILESLGTVESLLKSEDNTWVKSLRHEDGYTLHNLVNL